MSGYLETITGTIPHTQHEVDIQLNGKNLILTGGNGCGKTSFLKELNEKLDFYIIQRVLADKVEMEKQFANHKVDDFNYPKGTSTRIQLDTFYEDLSQKLKNLKTGVQATILDHIIFSEHFHNNKAIIRYFSAHRQAKIKRPEGVFGSTGNEFINQNNELYGPRLEQFLVRFKVNQSLTITEEMNPARENEIQSWFENFDQNLQYLMEDPTTHLVFDTQDLRFNIQQRNKAPFSFQTLSSGYSAIFNILADLLMRTVYFKVLPTELTGIVMIDEIDVHLHVSLQRKILPFLTKLFPKLQFIVTTHSPFVITSVSDTVIYDLSKREQISDDLTMYSYEAVVEGLLGVPPVSQELTKELNQLVDLMEDGSNNKGKIEKIVNKLRPVEEHLSDESKLTYHEAAFFLIKLKNAKVAEKN